MCVCVFIRREESAKASDWDQQKARIFSQKRKIIFVRQKAKANWERNVNGNRNRSSLKFSNWRNAWKCVENIGKLAKQIQQPQLAWPCTTTTTEYLAFAKRPTGRATSGARWWPLLKCKVNLFNVLKLLLTFLYSFGGKCWPFNQIINIYMYIQMYAHIYVHRISCTFSDFNYFFVYAIFCCICLYVCIYVNIFTVNCIARMCLLGEIFANCKEIQTSLSTEMNCSDWRPKNNNINSSRHNGNNIHPSVIYFFSL